MAIRPPDPSILLPRRRFCQRPAIGTLGSEARRGSRAAAAAGPAVLMDGHVHAISRVYWEKVDLWQSPAAAFGWDFARAHAAGVNGIIDNLVTYGGWNYNQAPKFLLRLLETAHRFAECHAARMAIALSGADARRIIASGRMALFLGCESGFDMEGDLDVLDAFYRLGLRSVQFTTQSGFNAFADSAMAPMQGGLAPDHYHGLNDRGCALVEEMNRLGILIDITHGTASAQEQIIAASRAPVVASHETFQAVSGVGLSDAMFKAIAAKGGLVGIHGSAHLVSLRYRRWLADHPREAAAALQLATDMIGYQPAVTRHPGDHGEYNLRFDEEFGERWRALQGWQEIADLARLIPTPDEWADHVAHGLRLAGADHIAIGLDLAPARHAVPMNAGGYPELVAALRRITTPANVRKIAGENWLRVFDQAKT